MDPISSNTGSDTGVYAMKKAMEVQGQGLEKLLDSAKAPTIPSASSSGSSMTGLGQMLDIKG